MRKIAKLLQFENQNQNQSFNENELGWITFWTLYVHGKVNIVWK
jgi:hypothetical protein